MIYCSKIFTGLCAVSFWLVCVPANPPDELHFVHLVEPVTLTAKAGSIHRLDIQFRIDSGYHIIGQQREESNFLPLTVNIADHHSIHFGPASFPPPKALDIDGLEDPLPVFEDVLKIELPVEIDALTKRGRQEVMAELCYQVCDNRKCFFPRALQFPITIRIQ